MDDDIQGQGHLFPEDKKKNPIPPLRRKRRKKGEDVVVDEKRTGLPSLPVVPAPYKVDFSKLEAHFEKLLEKQKGIIKSIDKLSTALIDAEKSNVTHQKGIRSALESGFKTFKSSIDKMSTTITSSGNYTTKTIESIAKKLVLTNENRETISKEDSKTPTNQIVQKLDSVVLYTTRVLSSIKTISDQLQAHFARPVDKETSEQTVAQPVATPVIDKKKVDKTISPTASLVAKKPQDYINVPETPMPRGRKQQRMVGMRFVEKKKTSAKRTDSATAVRAKGTIKPPVKKTTSINDMVRVINNGFTKAINVLSNIWGTLKSNQKSIEHKFDAARLMTDKMNQNLVALKRGDKVNRRTTQREGTKLRQSIRKYATSTSSTKKQSAFQSQLLSETKKMSASINRKLARMVTLSTTNNKHSTETNTNMKKLLLAVRMLRFNNTQTQNSNTSSGTSNNSSSNSSRTNNGSQENQPLFKGASKEIGDYLGNVLRRDWFNKKDVGSLKDDILHKKVFDLDPFAKAAWNKTGGKVFSKEGRRRIGTVAKRKWRNSRPIREKAMQFIKDKTKPVMSKSTKWLGGIKKDIIDTLKDSKKTLGKDVSQGVRKVVTPLRRKVVRPIRSLLSTKNLKKQAGSALSGVKKVAGKTGQAAMKGLDFGKDLLKSMGKMFGSLLKGLPSFLMAAGPILALAGGLLWAAWDGLMGFFKSGDWGVSKITGVIASVLGGTGSGMINAFTNAGKWALIGAGIGSIVPGVGTLVGGIVGAVFGAVVGYFGGEKIAGALQAIEDYFTDQFTAIIDPIVQFFDSLKKKLNALLPSWVTNVEMSKEELANNDMNIDTARKMVNNPKLTDNERQVWGGLLQESLDKRVKHDQSVKSGGSTPTSTTPTISPPEKPKTSELIDRKIEDVQKSKATKPASPIFVQTSSNVNTSEQSTIVPSPVSNPAMDRYLART